MAKSKVTFLGAALSLAVMTSAASADCVFGDAEGKILIVPAGECVMLSSDQDFADFADSCGDRPASNAPEWADRITTIFLTAAGGGKLFVDVVPEVQGEFGFGAAQPNAWNLDPKASIYKQASLAFCD